MTTFMILLAIIAVWNIAPIVLLFFLPIPMNVRLAAAKCFAFSAFPRGLLAFIPSIIAPVVVPIALLFTKYEDDHLPKLFTWWDNDVSINGDREEYWPLDYKGGTYYTKSHPRSFWGRFVWLGLRNRASRLDQMLGYTNKESDVREQWGDPKVGRNHEGWTVNRAGDAYQLYLVARLETMCIRINYGYKVWGIIGDGRKTANVVNIAFSLVRWTGKK